MAQFPAMPLWTDAYLGDTLHLSLEEHGAYLKMLMIAWRSPECCLPDNDHRIATMLGITTARWRDKIRPAIAPFWTIDAGTWRQKRLTKEREFSSKSIAKQREKAKQRWAGKSLESPRSGDAVAGAAGMPQGMPPYPYPLDSESERTSVASTETPAASSGATAVALLGQKAGSDLAEQPDLDALFYKRGKALLGQKAGGQLTRLRAAVGSVGVALEIIDKAQHKDSPAEYVAGCIRNRGNGTVHGRPARGGVVEALRRLREIDQRRAERAGDDADDGPDP